MTMIDFFPQCKADSENRLLGFKELAQGGSSVESSKGSLTRNMIFEPCDNLQQKIRIDPNGVGRGRTTSYDKKLVIRVNGPQFITATWTLSVAKSSAHRSGTDYNCYYSCKIRGGQFVT
jgi:hypothetical protein